MRRSILNKRTSNEYSRLTQNAKNGYQIAQQSTSEKYMQDKYGPFPESEHQKPYESPNEDYQGLENNYTPWSFPPYNPPGLPEFPDINPPVNPVTGSGGGGIQTVYLWEKYCTKDLRLNTPGTVEPGAEAMLSYSGGNPNYYYDLKTEKGEFIVTSWGGHSDTVQFQGRHAGRILYRAPSSVGIDTLTVTPSFMAFAQTDPCIVRNIRIKATVGTTSIFPLVFYRDGGNTMMGKLAITGGNVVTLSDTRTVASMGMANFTDKVYCHSKRFVHKINMRNSTVVTQELYLVAMSLKLGARVYFPAWSTLVAANPTFALITNTTETKITETTQLMADLLSVNTTVNGAHAYTPDGLLDNWVFLGTGESGDCEDFALTKAAALLALGYPASAMRLATGKSGVNGHAWLVVQTNIADYALDVGTDAVQLNSALTYTVQQRQTGTLWKYMSVFDNFIDATHAGYNTTTNEPNIWWYIYNPNTRVFNQIFDTVDPQQLPYNVTRRPTTQIEEDIGYGGSYINFNVNRYFNNGQGSPPWGGTINHVCNFSSDGLRFYVSREIDSIFAIWPVKYQESTTYYGIFEIASAGNGRTGVDSTVALLFVDTGGWVYYAPKYGKTYANAYSVSRVNLITEVVETYYFQAEYSENIQEDNYTYLCNSFDSVLIASPDNFYTMRIVHNIGNLHYTLIDGVNHMTQSTVLDTPTNGTFTEDYVWVEPATHILYNKASTYLPMPGMFTKNFSTGFYDHFTMEHPLGNIAEETFNYQFTLKLPFEANIACGTASVAYGGVPPPRRWPVAWFHLQRTNNIIQALLITTSMAWDVPFTEDDRRIYKDGVRIDGTLATAVGVTVDNILGLVYAPEKE